MVATAIGAKAKQAAEQELENRLELSRRSLSFFCQQAWSIIEPATPLKWNWHHELICEELQEVAEGRNKRLIINVMPRSLKSLIVSVFFPAWEWTRAPSMTYLCLSYSSDLAKDHSYKRRQVIESSWYQRLSKGQCRLSDDRNRVKEFSNSSQGVMYARGMDSAVTGVGGLRIICDDGNNPEQVESETVREGCIKKWRDYSTTRQNDPKTTAVIIVQQRTHERDITGYELSENASKWKHIKLSTECLAPETITFPSGAVAERTPEQTVFKRKAINSEGKPVIIRKRIPGAFLHPARFGHEENTDAKSKLGAYMYAGRHLQQPYALEGGIFGEAKWKRWEELPKAGYELALTCDPSFGSMSKTASFVVVQLWLIMFPKFYLVTQFRKRCGFNDTKQAIRDILTNYAHLGFINYKLIEKKASGADVIEDLKAEFSGIVAINPQGDKETRGRAVAPYFESGNIWLPDNSIADDIEAEFSTFPNGATDDQIDAAGQLILYFAKKNRGGRRTVPAFSIGG